MYISFTADSFFSDNDGDVVYGSLQAFNESDHGTQEHYFNFQRSLEPGNTDGIYTEYNGQENGGFNMIKHCQFSHNKMTIQLSQQLGSLQGIDGFDMSLNLEDDVLDELKNFLFRVFQGYEDILDVI